MLNDISIRAKIFVPLVLVSLIGIVVIAVTVKRLARESLVEQTVISATNKVNEYKSIRAYYTKNVVVKVKAQGGCASTTTMRRGPTPFRCRLR